MKRRKFIYVAVTGAAGAVLGVPVWQALSRRGRDLPKLNLDRHFPILPVESHIPLQGFTGDEPVRPHSVLWQKGEYLASKGGVPAPSEQARVVVVGGGMAGLMSSYFLRDLGPVLLEQASRLGGNSKGERWEDLAYSIGAAYVSEPDKGSQSWALLEELGMFPQGRGEKASDEACILMRGKIHEGFWSGATDPARAAEFKRVAAVFKKHLEESYPDLPLEAKFHALDRMSFRDWVRREIGKTHPHIEEFLREYCWSSFAADDSELSAAQTLNFLLADMEGIVAFPGGNSAIAERLCDRLVRQLPQGSLRPSSLVVDVAADDRGVTVAYIDSQERLRSIRAEACVVAAPKFVAKHVVRDLPEPQLAAMRALKYRAYLVANVLVRKRVTSKSYELFRLRGVGRGAEDVRKAAEPVVFTDLIFGAWAANDRPDRSVLTLYRGVPYDSGRGELYQPEAFGRERKAFEDELPEMLAALGLTTGDVAQVRITRWGHALPVAARGLLADGVAARASAPLKDRVFFAEQDNQANPAFESALSAAWSVVEPIRKGVARA